ncbi:MAG: Cof-type HAD-IIB family hydrolase [Christensenella sp.]
MAYRLIALDLDDTLLNSKKQITKKNHEALAQAREKGVRVILASGRAYPGITAFNEALSNTDYTITCGGAQVVDPDGTVIHSTYVEPEAAKQVMRWAMMHNIHFQIYLDDGFYYLKKNEQSDFYESFCNYTGTADPDLMNIETVLTSKILLIDTPEKIKNYRKELSALFPELALKRSQEYFLEIMNPEATKGNALKYLAQKLNIEQHQILAMGDSEIDESMIEYAGMGIAMQNAYEACKAVANDVTASCDEDGVAVSIEKYILGANK